MYLEHIHTIPFSCFPEGPNAEVFEIHLVADNKTITQVDMGELGGVRPATAEFKDDSLITYLYNDKVIDILATRTINPTSKLFFSQFVSMFALLMELWTSVEAKSDQSKKTKPKTNFVIWWHCRDPPSPQSVQYYLNGT